MKHTVKIYETKSGYLVEEHRFTAEGAAPRGWCDNDVEAQEAEFAADNFNHKIFDEKTGKISSGAVVGDIYMVGVCEYENGTRASVALHADNGEGWGGNTNPEIKYYHGWRGTTNNCAFYGRGVRKCVSYRVTGQRSKKIRIVYGQDIKKYEK